MATAAYPRQLQQLNVDLDLEDELGRGAYGTVYKAKFLGRYCAVKFVHAAPLSQIDEASLARFNQECKFMNSLRHPNLVQSVGTVTLSLVYPILVMELMDCDLTSYLQGNLNLELRMEISIADDIINGIEFLHHNGLVHRDLSGANVLMVDSTAKISDLGMAKLLSAFESNCQLTPCPGNKVYMPLTALFDNPSYSEKIDIYCYGVLLIQIVTKKYPQITLNYREQNGQRVFVKERERRQDHISEISDKHILKHIALCCLNDDESLRPSAIDIQNKIGEIKASHSLIAVAVPNVQNAQIFNVAQLLKEHQSLVASKAADNNHIQQLTERVSLLELGMEQQKVVMEQQKVTMEQRHQREKEDFKRELEQFALQLRQEASQEVLKAQESSRIIEENAKQEVLLAQQQAQQEIGMAQEKARMAEEKEQQVRQEAEEHIAQIHSIHSASLSSISTTHSDALFSVSRNSSGLELLFGVVPPVPSYLNPNKMHQDCTAAVVNSETIYVRPARTRRILTLDNANWSSFPLDCEYHNCALAFVCGSLTTIGGTNKGTCVNTLCRTIACSSEWLKDLPPMTVARELPLACTSGKLLIVVGGRNKKMLNVVELFHEESRQWQTACCIPYPLHFASIATYDESLVVTGVRERMSKETHHIYCKLTDLTYSANGNKDAITDIWKKQVIAIPPKSSLTKFGGLLLAIGGQDQLDNEATGSVYSYCPELDNWRQVATLNNPRYLCFAVMLSESLYIIGGDTGSNNLTDSVEVGTYQ